MSDFIASPCALGDDRAITVSAARPHSRRARPISGFQRALPVDHTAMLAGEMHASFGACDVRRASRTVDGPMIAFQRGGLMIAPAATVCK